VVPLAVSPWCLTVGMANDGNTDSATTGKAGFSREGIDHEIYTILSEEDVRFEDAIGRALSERRTKLFQALTKQIDEAVQLYSRPLSTTDQSQALHGQWDTSEAVQLYVPPLSTTDTQQAHTVVRSWAMEIDGPRVKRAEEKTTSIQASNLDEELVFAKFGTLEEYLDMDLSSIKSFVSRRRCSQSVTNLTTSIVTSMWFETCISACIVLNAGLIAWSTNHSMQLALDKFSSLRPGEDPTSQRSRDPMVSVLDVGFAIIFTIELALRLVAQELVFFFGHGAKWNLLDIFLVLIGWLDVIVTIKSSDGSTSFSVMRMLRMLRMLRSLRVVKVLHMFREMRVVLLSFFGALIPMIWTMLGTFIILYIFVTIFMQGAAAYVSEAKYGETTIEDSLRPQFGSFMRTYKTLIMSITGGDDWTKYYDTLEKVSPIYSVLFMAYIILMAFGLLNIITAIFVEGSLSRAREDFELLKAEERIKLGNQRKRLIKLFRRFDPDMTGKITREKWTDMVNSEDTQEMMEYFSMLNIDKSKADDVFRLLDVDESGELEVEEFIGGCMQIQGSASYVDVEMLMTATKTLMTRCAHSFDAIKAGVHEEHMMSRARMNLISEQIAVLETQTRERSSAQQQYV